MYHTNPTLRHSSRPPSLDSKARDVTHHPGGRPFFFCPSIWGRGAGGGRRAGTPQLTRR